MNLRHINEPQWIENADQTKSRYGVPLEKNTKKRRISFSGRWSVREFHPEEKPKSWDDSYEISDYTSMSQNMSTYMTYNIYSKENDGGQANGLDFQSHPKDMKARRQRTSNFEKKWRSEEKTSGGTTFVDNDITMGISVELNDRKNYEDDCTVNSAKITERTAMISGKAQSPQPTHSRKILVNNIFPSDMYNSTISANPIPKPVYHEYECAIITSKRDYQTPENFAGTGFHVDFTRCDSNSSFTNTCNFLYTPTKTLKLNLRQLNAAIGDGKIVVFPEKRDHDEKVHNSVKCNETARFNGHVKDFQVKNCQNISNNGKQYTSDIPIELQRTRLLDVNDINNPYDGSECDDIFLSNSFIVNEKLDSKIISEHSKCDEKRKSSNGTLLHGPVYTKELALKPFSSTTITLSSLSYTPPLQYDPDGKSLIDRTSCAVQDMSLDITNFEAKQDCLHRSILYNVSEINSNYSRLTMELDIHSQNDLNTKKSGNTIFFNQGTEFLHSDTLHALKKEKSGTNPVCINDFKNDSLIQNPTDFRGAECFSNYERRIEGTPHRSILEFVNLEKEAQQEGVDHHEHILFQTSETQITKPQRYNQKSLKVNDSTKCVKMLKPFEDPRPTDVLDNSLTRTPVWNSVSSKRLTEHLTPNLPLPKRRHTLLFQDCAIDDSILLSCEFDFVNDTCSDLFYQNGFDQNENVMNINRSNRLNSLSQGYSLKRVDAIQTNKNNNGSLNGFDVEHSRQADFVTCHAFQASISVPTKKINAITSNESGTIDYNEYAIEVTKRAQLRDSISTDPLSSLILPNTILCEAENYKSSTNECKDNTITIIKTSVHDKPLTVGNIDNYLQNQGFTGLNPENTPECLRCKRCQGRTSDTIESFALPSISQFPSVPFGRLEKLRKNSNLESAHEYWRRRSLEKKGNFFSVSVKQSSEPYKTNSDYNNFLATTEVLKKTLKQISDLDVLEQFQRDSFFDSLSELLRTGLPNWILNRELKGKRLVQFNNKKLISCAIEILYDDQDLLGNELFVQGATLYKITSNHWKPLDNILYAAFDTKLALSLNSFQSGITKSVEIFKLLKLANKSCEQVLKGGISLWQLICKMRASLFRQSDRIIVRKVVREFVYEDGVHCPLVITTEFQIELRNIQTLSFRDIKAPPLYAFSKQLESLPHGIDFLKVFLENPTHYLHRRALQ